MKFFEAVIHIMGVLVLLPIMIVTTILFLGAYLLVLLIDYLKK